MIISASRRTDIPAFYPEWLMNRLKAGGCDVANPVNPSQVRRVSLAPEDVDVVVFWTKNPRPLLPHLGEIDRLGLRYMFLFTLNDYPAGLEPDVPGLGERLETFRELSRRLGPDRVVWRYDPIILSHRLGVDAHLAAFARLAEALGGFTRRVIVSFVDFYRKTGRRLEAVALRTGDQFVREPLLLPGVERLVAGLLATAGGRGLEIQSCAEDPALRALGLPPGKCIDDRLIQRVFGLCVSGRKDAGQRPLCGCVESRDIGAPDSCGHGCEYCYSTRDPVAARERRRRHDPLATML